MDKKLATKDTKGRKGKAYETIPRALSVLGGSVFSLSRVDLSHRGYVMNFIKQRHYRIANRTGI